MLNKKAALNNWLGLLFVIVYRFLCFCKIVNTEKKSVKIAKEHEVIALIQQIKAEGANLQAIADELNNQGITTKRGANWQPMQVSRVLARG